MYSDIVQDRNRGEGRINEVVHVPRSFKGRPYMLSISGNLMPHAFLSLSLSEEVDLNHETKG